MLKNKAPMGVQVLAIKSLEAHANSSIVRQFSRSAKKDPATGDTYREI